MLGMESVDLPLLFELLRVTTVVANVVMAFGYADLVVAAVAAVVGEHEGANAREIRLEREDHHVAHKPNVLAVISGNAVGFTNASGDQSGLAVLKLLESLLDLSNAFEVLIQLSQVSRTQLTFEAGGVLRNQVQNALAE